MGVIQKETIKGSTWSYVGAFLGFVNTGLLFPKIFSTSEIGLLSVLVAISALFSQFSSLGMNSVTARLFPYFNHSKENKAGYFTLLMLVTTAGFLVSFLVGLLFKDWIIESKTDDSGLLVKYAFYLIPMTIFTLYFNALDYYNKMLYDITSGIFYKEFLLRVLNFISIGLYFFALIDFDVFVFLYVLSYVIPLVGLLVVLLIRKELTFHWPLDFLSRGMKRELFLVALFGILAGFSGIIIDYLDKYLVGKYLGLSDAGIYTTVFYIGTMILLPSRALNKISSTLIAESWKSNDLETIKTIYTKSSINQFVFGLFLLVLILTNLHNIFQFLPAQYVNGKWVLIIIGITNMIIMLSGVSYSIISTAKYYWYMSALMLIQIVLIITTNILLIPLIGMTGAAVASFISVSVIRIGSIFIIGFKSKIWPFRKGHLVVFCLALAILIVSFILPASSNYYVDMFLKSFFIFVMYVSGLYLFKIVDFQKVIKGFKKLK